MNDKEYAEQIAKDIFAQLGGNRFIAMTGAKVSYSINDKQQPVLICLLPGDLGIKQNINLFTVTYDVGMDLYILNFINTSLPEDKKVIKHYRQVYADDLVPFFESETGLYTYL